MIDHPPVEYRTWPDEGVEIRSVSFPKRTIELVVMPYDTETVVSYGGRMIREIVARGAFDGIEARMSHVGVNRDHDNTRLCGKAVSFRPTRDEGLVAEVRMSNTPLGNETLELSADGVLGASAGFWPWVDAGTGKVVGEEWPEKDLRRLTKISLHHIAMTPDPAYRDAKVLDVRDNLPPVEITDGGIVVVATPNLDRVKGWHLADEAARILPVR